MDVVTEDTPEAKESITRYRVLGTKGNSSLLEVAFTDWSHPSN